MFVRSRHFVSSCLLAVLVLFAVPAVAAPGDQIVHIRIRGPLLESPPAMDLGILLGEEAPANMFDLLRTLRKARADESVKALVFDLDEARLGLAQIEELRGQFEQLRAADKDVWCYLEAAGPGTYLLASAATKVVMMPRGELFIVGLHSTPMYFRGLLDKIGATADVVHIGAYKSAGEMFSRDGPSPEADENMNALLDGIYDAILDGIARSRRLSPARVRELFDAGPYSAREALEAGLVDALDYREDFADGIKRRYGEDAKIVRDYGEKSGPKIDFENPFAIFKVFGDLFKGPAASRGDAIAVIYVESVITTGKSEDGPFGKTAGSSTIRRAIDKAAADDTIRAVVLRVDSPGGSAIASEIIAEATRRLKQKKPFVVSMGDVAGSGGYYVSCLADTIFAQPATITGSIGVVGLKLVTRDMWGKLGITMHEYKRGEQADIMSSYRPWTDEQRARILRMMTRVYDEFKGRVLEGRSSKIKGDLENLAGGRVYTGAQALEKGLVDRLGGLSDAIRFAADQAEISDYELRILPRPKTFFDLFAKELGMKDDDDQDLSLRRAAAVGWEASPAVLTALQVLDATDPQGAAALRQGLLQLRMIGREHVLMISPPLPVLR